jgi:dCTP deaminase
MVLSQPELRAAVTAGTVRFDPPLEERQWGPASVDLRLGFSFTKLRKLDGITVSLSSGLGVLAGNGFWDTIDLQEFDKHGKRETFTIEPGELILAMTYEKITVPDDMIAIVEGRSTYARVGLSMHQTAPWIQPGWPGKAIVLEIYNMGPLKIQLTPLLDRPCQLSFFPLSHSLPPEMRYGAKPSDAFGKQEHPLNVNKPAQ